jgi:chemotaxis protein histidine kinase CheA
VNLINGYLNLHSAPGKGTRVQVFIPLTPQAADRLQRGVVSAGDS